MVFVFVLVLHRAMTETGVSGAGWRFTPRALR
jgi:hypothetical protein